MIDPYDYDEPLDPKGGVLAGLLSGGLTVMAMWIGYQVSAVLP